MMSELTTDNQWLLTNNTDQDRVVSLFRTFLNSDFFEGDRGENARKIMKEFIGSEILSSDDIKIIIFETVLKLLFHKMKDKIDLFICFLERSPLSQPRVEKALFALLAQISQLHDSRQSSIDILVY